MYFVDNPQELIGKTIAYVNMNKYADRILIATTDGGILTVSQWDDGSGFDSEIEVYPSYNTEEYIRRSKKNNKYIYTDLIMHGVFTEEEYNELVEKYNKQQEEWKRQSEEKQKQAEYEQYLKLKEKFEK